MLQSPANTRVLLNSKCLLVKDLFSVRYIELFFLYTYMFTESTYCKSQYHSHHIYLQNWYNTLCTERKSTLKMQPSLPVPLEHLDPQTPQMCQLVSQWQKLWLLTMARQTRLEQHQQTLKEVRDICFFISSRNIKIWYWFELKVHFLLNR